MIYVCSRYRGPDVEYNVDIARKACKFFLLQGMAPFAPHLLYTQMLDDNVPEERMAGIAAGCEVMKQCDELYVCCTFKDGKYSETSEGMRHEIKFAEEHGIPVIVWYTTDDGETWTFI